MASRNRGDVRKDVSLNYGCGECGKTVDADTYHPYIACVIFKATGRDPLPYLEDVGRYYAEHPERLPVRA